MRNPMIFFFSYLGHLIVNLFIHFILQVSDMSLNDYIAVNPSKHATFVPHTAGRYSVKRFRKAQCPIVERLTNSLMMHGRNNGKKLMAVRIVKHAMEIIHLLTDQNPIQVIVDAVINRWEDLLPLKYAWFITRTKCWKLFYFLNVKGQIWPQVLWQCFDLTFKSSHIDYIKKLS